MFFYQLRAVAARGFHAAIVITGHYGGNEHDFKRVAAVFTRHNPLQVWAGADYEFIEFADFHGDHAGRCETSQLWALRPELVDMSRLAQGSPDQIGRVMATGPDAGQASRRLGEEIIRSQIAWLGRKAAELLAAYQPPAVPAQPTPGNPLGALTFDEAEQLWCAEIEPLLAEFTSMNLKPGQDRADPASSWAPNEMSRLAAHP
jgi:creatinine amidohydrolase